MFKKAVFTVIIVGSLILGGSFVLADEGMWLLNNLPLQQLKDKYGFVPTSDWVEKVQKSSARLPNCSASFVSSDGLVFTNGHCAEGSVQLLSTPTNNLYQKGFYAKTYAQELKTDRTLKVLMSMQDVTEAIRVAVSAKDIPGDPAIVRQSVINNLAKVFSDESHLTCEPVALYQGAQYHVYCYKVYNDVRLVFSSEKNVWFMGGDADNFEYPRYTLDVAFFRVYENGKPAKTSEHFKWSKSGAKEGELIFVSGHPGSTDRLLTSSALKTERNISVPFLLDLFGRRERTLQQFMLRGKEQRRIAESDLFSWQNSRKLYVGKIRGLQDPKLIKAKEDLENKFFADNSITNPAAANNYANGVIMVRDAQEAIRANYVRAILLGRGFGFDTELYGLALALLNPKEAQADAELRLSNKTILNLEYEEAKLTDSLTHFIEVFGADSDVVVYLMKLFGNGPSEMAHNLVYGTKLSDADEYLKLAQGGIQAVKNSDDPMIRLMIFAFKEGEGYVSKYRKAAEDEKAGYSLISDALFQVQGDTNYPDATFTLRLSFGTVMGDSQNGVPAFTTIGGAYKHSADFGNSGDYKLPSRWLVRKKHVKLTTPLNFTSDLDITGGNSGSPVFNKNLEIVGVVFDSNIDGLVSDYDFNYNPKARAVSVHSAGILEILSKIYRADALVRELTR
ncbi:MAG: hypothetical protein A3C61_00720 [Candidatus Yanofskybacteria bacterium RIFCSPHIGHO2_02_FULL_39_10]|uniref:Dipeptidyl-peptidase n=1 Tax=Candidatus Yanofskybacteria bacterium RIFCSPHIGHO2_02_FULL_39_10 TaxID=1802674 RepID=A0A1F8F887_9BACT|nr:MAG: hypothetical protein A3C61_00720 [Candidatus Yanofskybacteria bacterium RIFCSPHIGHO2_02_FULL_39_10]